MLSLALATPLVERKGELNEGDPMETGKAIRGVKGGMVRLTVSAARADASL